VMKIDETSQLRRPRPCTLDQTPGYCGRPSIAKENSAR
jgi:hypothetical protein